MSRKQQSKLDVIRNTVKRFNLNNRAIVNYISYYRLEDGTMDAICYYINKKDQCGCLYKHFKDTKESRGIDVLYGLHRFEWTDLIPSVRHIQDINFWRSIQELHDVDDNWDDNGLSENGKYFVKELIEKHK